MLNTGDLIYIRESDMSLMWPTNGPKKFLSSGLWGIIIDFGVIGWTSEDWWTIYINGETWEVNSKALERGEKTNGKI